MALQRYRAGKKPARLGAVKFGFANYFDERDLPTPPKTFGNRWQPSPLMIADPREDASCHWGMFGNDEFGCCVWADAAHSVMKWCGELGKVVRFNRRTVLRDYADATGFDPSKPDTDQGTDMEEAAKYRRRVGVLDADGNRHKVDAYVALPFESAQRVSGTIATATWLMGAASLGVRLPRSAEAQFDRGQPWEVVRGERGEDGHDVLAVGRNSAGNLLLVTWGKIHAATPAWLAEYMDEGVACISLDRLTNKVSRENFGYDELARDLAALAAR